MVAAEAALDPRPQDAAGVNNPAPPRLLAHGDQLTTALIRKRSTLTFKEKTLSAGEGRNPFPLAGGWLAGQGLDKTEGDIKRSACLCTQ